MSFCVFVLWVDTGGAEQDCRVCSRRMSISLRWIFSSNVSLLIYFSASALVMVTLSFPPGAWACICATLVYHIFPASGEKGQKIELHLNGLYKIHYVCKNPQKKI